MAPDIFKLLKFGTSFLPGGPLIGAGINVIDQFSTSNDPTKTPNPLTRTPAYKKGGLINVSTNSFKVKADADKDDALLTKYKGSDIRLDNDEVVDTKNDFVFSDDLINPITKRPFSKEAEALFRKRAQYEKTAYSQQNETSASSIKLVDAALKQLATEQENLKTPTYKKGGVMAYKKGGPINPKLFQQLYNQRITTPFQTLTEDGILGPKTRAAQETELGKRLLEELSTRPPLRLPVNPKDFVPKFDETFPEGTPQELADLYASDGPLHQQNAIQELALAQRQEAIDARNRELMIESPAIDTPTVPTTQTQDKPAASILASNPNDFSLGDALQLAPAVTAMLRLRKGAQKETPQFDRTRITKERYSPNALLTNNQASYSNALNSASGPLTAVRGLQNSLLANKLKADNQVLSQYDQMNQRANTNYESRLQNQQRYNNAVRTSTDDLNSRNSAAYDASIRNVSQQVANIGLGLNQKEQDAQRMNLYRATYSDVYDRILNNLLNGQ